MNGTPVIPETITVHLGTPSSSAENVTVSFSDYIKNVASSEIYPTWPENAIRANIYAQISYALNRVYTEWYRARGYDFDITNSTAYDQSFVKGRNIFENISEIVDEIFNDYIRRQGFVEPLFATYCDGVEVSCDGLSQWGSVTLAEEGLIPYDILINYYGDNIELVFDAPVQNVTESYPGTPLRVGSSGDDVRRIQNQLNRISKNYPLIPKIPNPTGVFGVSTEDAVRKFQQTFNLTPDGIVGKGTWYQIQEIFVAVKKLADVDSEGQTIADVSRQYKGTLREGDTGESVRALQYYLLLISVYNNAIPAISIDGIFGNATKNAVEAFQRYYGIEVTGEVDRETWSSISNTYLGIVETISPENVGNNTVPYPGTPIVPGSQGEYVRIIQEYLLRISENYDEIPRVTVNGTFGETDVEAVSAFQELFGLEVTGFVGPATWAAIAEEYNDLTLGESKNEGQAPGYELTMEG
ncbi:MAG: spore cortex-lytic protein [Ruminococcaceae bacterium]|nr:spore cortex-lytic protein [Oscillospiraceae bacterium]